VPNPLPLSKTFQKPSKTATLRSSLSMSHQKSIHSFFQKKEGAEAKEGGESPQPKRVKRSVEGEERNQCAVKEMLKAMVELRPACWKEALGGEFNKSYFYNLIAFLNKEIAAGKVG
jgi:hypothetical protein